MIDSHESLVSIFSKHLMTVPRLCSVGILIIGLLCWVAIGRHNHTITQYRPITQTDVAALLGVIANADLVAVFAAKGRGRHMPPPVLVP